MYNVFFWETKIDVLNKHSSFSILSFLPHEQLGNIVWKQRFIRQADHAQWKQWTLGFLKTCVHVILLFRVQCYIYGLMQSHWALKSSRRLSQKKRLCKSQSDGLVTMLSMTFQTRAAILPYRTGLELCKHHWCHNPSLQRKTVTMRSMLHFIDL